MLQQIDLYSSQKLSKSAILYLFVMALVRWVKNLWPILAIYIIRPESGVTLKVFIGVGAVFILIFSAVSAYLKYAYTYFYVNKSTNDFHFHTGFINKSETVIPINKIQDVTLSQKWFHQMIQAYKVTVNTAGSSGKEVELSAVTLAYGNAFRQSLMQLKEEVAQEETPIENEIDEVVITPEKPSPKEEKISISPISILLYGISSHFFRTIALALSFLFYIRQYINEKLFDAYVADHVNSIGEQIEKGQVAWYSFLIIMLLASIIVLIFNGLYALYKFFNYVILYTKDSMSFQYGLINTEKKVFNKSKLQRFTQRQNLIQKGLGLWMARLYQASSGRTSQKQSVQIPGMKKTQIEDIQYVSYQTIPNPIEEIATNYRRLILWLGVRFLICIGIFFIPFFDNSTRITIVLVLAIYCIIDRILFYKKYRLKMDDRFLVKEYGSFGNSKEITEIHKIQAITVKQFIWQKRTGLCNVHFHLSGGNISFYTTSLKKIQNISNYFLFSIEYYKKPWM